MVCMKCKKEIADGSSFCNWCGFRQGAHTPTKKAKSRGNGQGSVYKRGSSWIAEITLGYCNDKRISRKKCGFKTKKEALEYLSVLASGTEDSSKLTLQKLYESWESSYMVKLSKSKQTCYKIAHEKLKPLLFRDIKTIRLDEIQSLVNSLSGGYYPKRDVKSLLSHLYKRAVIDGKVPNNLAAYIELPTLEQPNKDAFKQEEIDAMWQLWNSGSDVFIGFVLVMIYTGMRPGELQNVKKQNIDYEKQIITGAGIKTKKGKEMPVLIAAKIAPVIKSLEAYSTTDYFMPHDDSTMYERYYASIEKAGCTGKRRLSPHCCRHTTATALTLENVAPAVIKDVMRHEKYDTSLGYTHIDTTSLLDAVNKIK